MNRTEANGLAFERLCAAEPVLVDIRPAIEVLPGMTPATVLTSGPPMPWERYVGGQRDAVIGGALFEGLASDADDAARKLAAGEIVVDGCHDYGAVGSLAGIYTASMPVFVVENRHAGINGFCNMYEGTDPRRLNYGVYDEGVRERLLFVQDTIAPVLAEAVRAAGGIPLKPIMRRALHMGDELHSRNTAASLLFTRELFPHLLRLDPAMRDAVERTVAALTEDHYFFLRLSMAAAKCTADAAADIEGSGVVTAMAFNCNNFAIRVGGLGDRWFLGPHASVDARLFEGHTEDEIAWMGGESIIAETIGLGGFAQAAAFPAAAIPGRVRRRDGRAQPPALRDRRRREPGLQDPLSRLSRHADGHRHPPRGRNRRAAGDGHRHRRARRRADRRRHRSRADRMLRGGGRGLGRALRRAVRGGGKEWESNPPGTSHAPHRF